MQFFLKSFFVFLYFLGLCQSSVVRQKRSPYPNPYDGLPVYLDGRIVWTSDTRPYTFSQASVDKHFAPDVVIEAIGNSLASTDANERRAAIVLAATQRPKKIRGKASIRDAPQVYTDASGNNRVRFLTDSYGNNKNPTFIDPDDHSSTRRHMTLGDVMYANTFFQNSNFPQRMMGNTLFAKDQWKNTATGTLMSQIYFSDGSKVAIQFAKTNSGKKKHNTRLIDAANLGLMGATLELKAFGFSGGMTDVNTLEFEHLATGVAPTIPFANEHAFDACKTKVCDKGY